MSRSYKKIPLVKDKNKGSKKFANRTVRRYDDSIASGGGYRKIFCSYNISDFSFTETFEEYKQRNEYIGKDYSYIEWYKLYKMK